MVIQAGFVRAIPKSSQVRKKNSFPFPVPSLLSLAFVSSKRLPLPPPLGCLYKMMALSTFPWWSFPLVINVTGLSIIELLGMRRFCAYKAGRASPGCCVALPGARSCAEGKQTSALSRTSKKPRTRRLALPSSPRDTPLPQRISRRISPPLTSFALCCIFISRSISIICCSSA